MRKIKLLSEAREILSDVQSGINKSIADAFDDWLKIREFSYSLGGGILDFKNRTKASIIHDNIEKYIKGAFYEKEGVVVDHFNGIFGMLVSDQLFIRFKKMDDTYSVRNAATIQNSKYHNQLEFPGIPPEPTLLFAGYIPDKTWSSIKGIYIACWVKGKLSWVDDQGRYTAEQLALDLDGMTEEQVYENIETRVRIKAGKGKGKQKSGTNDN